MAADAALIHTECQSHSKKEKGRKHNEKTDSCAARRHHAALALRGLRQEGRSGKSRHGGKPRRRRRSYGTGVDKFSSYGPYKIVSYQESKEIVFTRNEGWFGYADERYDGMYQTTDINLQQIDEHTTQLSMFLQGNLDAVGLAQDDMEKYGTSDYVYYTPTSNTYYLALNTDFDMLKSREVDGVNKTILTYIDFRKAMSYSFDRSDYVKSCAPTCDPAFGLLNDMYICDPVTGEAYRDCEYAQAALCEIYGVDSVDDLTGYNKDEASRLLQSAYDQCLADGNISDTDVVEVEYHVYGTDSIYQKMVDYIQDAMLAAAEGTSLEGRIKFVLVEDQDYYNTMQNGQDDMINGAWGGAELDPYSMMICWTDPDYVMEYGFDVYQDLTISVQGEDVTLSYYDWYNELYNGYYAIANLDVRNEILAGMEKGLLRHQDSDDLPGPHLLPGPPHDGPRDDRRGPDDPGHPGPALHRREGL